MILGYGIPIRVDHEEARTSRNHKNKSYIRLIYIYIFPWFSYVGIAYERSALKVMLHIVGWQAQQ